MKTICFFSAFIFFVASNAQNPKGNSYYLKQTLGIGTHISGGYSAHFTSKKGFSVAVQFVFETRDATHVPSDYENKGIVILFDRPQTSLVSGAILAGKAVEHPSKLMQFDLRAGINYCFLERPVNFQRRFSGAGWFSSGNYNYDIEKKRFIGLVINPTINFNLTMFLGLSIGARANINHQDMTFGFEGSLIIGYLRGERVKKS